MSFTNALYYPWIQIQDEQWLRTACLYWEKIHTIVPGSVIKPYTRKLSRELEDAGVLEPLRVDSRKPEIEALTNDVLAYLDSQEAVELLLNRSKRRTSTIHADKLPYGISRIHGDKMSGMLRNRLDRGHSSPSEWVKVNSEFADFYMTLLANRLAERKGLGLLTSSLDADRLAGTARSGSRAWNSAQPDARFWRDGKSAQHPARLNNGILVDLVLGGIAIAPDVPLKALLEFRRKHSDELARLRKKLGELASKIPQESSIEAARQCAQDLVTDEVNPALNDLRAALRSSRIKSFTDSLLKVSFLSAAPTSGLIVLGLAVPTALLVGAGISLTASTILYSEEKKKVKRENAYAYLLAMQRKFA